MIQPIRKIRAVLAAIVGRRRPLTQQPSRARLESNRWLRAHCASIGGRVLSIGSGTDADGEGSRYRDYFTSASSYITSEAEGGHDTDLVLDVRAMHELGDATIDCVFCSGVLEHVDDYLQGLAEITRILKTGGILLLGLPFRQAIHMPPQDFWRFTEHGIRVLLNERYAVEDICAIDLTERNFPAAYWAKARKIRAALASVGTTADSGCSTSAAAP